MSIYSTKKIAELVGVHPNTVRVYEEWGYISPVKRADNGYRQYTELHLLQLRIVRLAFSHELLQKDFRKKAISIVKASGAEQFAVAHTEALRYLEHLQREHYYILKTIEVADNWSKSVYATATVNFTHRQMARLLGITEEVLRNWERNGLFTTARNSKRHRIYTELDMERLLVIRSLRSANFSYASILRFFLKANCEEGIDTRDMFNYAGVKDEIIHATDQLELTVRCAIADINEITVILSKMV